MEIKTDITTFRQTGRGPVTTHRPDTLYIQTVIQTDRWTDKQTQHTDRKTDRQPNIQATQHTYRNTDRQPNIQADTTYRP